MSKIVYPAVERNKTFILDVLKSYIDATKPGKLLEIASGTGQHAAHFAPSFPQLTFQPSEFESSLLDSINAYAAECPSQNILPPVIIDVTQDSKEWAIGDSYYDYLLNVNMMHISPYECTEGLFVNGAKVLKPGGYLFTYGPYANGGVIEPQSNVEFDASLRGSDASWGLRDIVDLVKLGERVGLGLLRKYDLPANNKCLVWRKNCDEVNK